jgi:predicted Zn-dependent protease
VATYHEIERLESELQAAPDSPDRRERLLFAYAEDDRTLSDPRRFAHIRWFIQRHPDHPVCRTPLAKPDPERHPEAYAAIVDEWRRALETHPGNHAISRAAAMLIALRAPDDARSLLERAVAASPDDPDLWVDLGRTMNDPRLRLAAFQRARRVGSTAPNLLVWTAHTAALAGELDAADAACVELATQLHEARQAHGDALEWPESGRALWARARERTGDDDAALQLTQAISDYNNRTHWVHTVHGMIAADLGDTNAAVRHLHASAQVTPDFRLRAYGPCLDLARRLYDLGRPTDVIGFLHEWEKRWDDGRVRAWLEQAQRGERPGSA